MNNETYQALKQVLNYFEVNKPLTLQNDSQLLHSLYQIQCWIDEVAKEYEGKNASELQKIR